MNARGSRLLAAGALAVAAGAAVVGLAAPAHAAEGHIVTVESKDGRLNVVFEARDLPPGSQVDRASVRLTLDGTPLEATASPVGGSAVVSRTAVLVLDTSGSMRGEGLAGAKSAARAFLAAAPADLRIGLVTFSDTATVRTAPTTDRAALTRAVNALTATGGTALYDGVGLGLDTLGSGGIRRLVVLSDGENSTGKANLATTVAAVKSAKVSLDAVSFRTGSADAALIQLTAAGGGSLVATSDAAGLTEVFRQSAEQLSGQVLISAALPAGRAGGSGTVAIQATAAGRPITDSALALLDPKAGTQLTGTGPAATPAPAGPVPVSDSVLGGQSRMLLAVAVVLVFLGLVGVVAVVLSSMGGKQQSVIQRRLEMYSVGGRTVRTAEETHTALGTSAVARSAVEFAGKVVARRGLEQRLAAKLETSGVPLKAAEWLVLHVGAALLLPVVLLVVTGNMVLAAAGLIGGGLLPLMFLSFKERRRTRKFAEQLPSTLQLLAGSLSAGYSLPQAADTVAREAADPVAGEFNRALVQARLGVPVEDALESVAERMNSKDFGWVVMAIRIQREVGGNLAELLNTVAGTLRERDRLRRQVLVLSAEGRLSGMVLGGLPVFFALYLGATRPEYISVLITDPIGLVMTGVAAVAMVIGGLWMKKVVKVEV
jgi:tight adherence protein B